MVCICMYIQQGGLISLERFVLSIWVFTLPLARYSVRPLLLHFFTTQRAYNDLINRSPSILPGRNLEAGDILGGRVTSGREWRSHRGQARGPLSSSGTLRSASFPSCFCPPSCTPPSIRAPSHHLASRRARQLRSPSLPRPLFPSRFPPPVPLRRATADTRRSYALHIQGDCIIHNDPTRR